MAYISRSRSRSVSTAPFTRATGLSLTWRAGACEAVVFATPVGAWEATWAEATENESATRSNAQIGSWYLMVPRLLNSFADCIRKKKGREILSPSLVPRDLYWKTVLMVLVLLASFASPKWH